MSLEDLDDSDIETLRELLESSGRATSQRRKALCIEIKIDPGEFIAIGTLTTHDFAVELIYLLQERKLEESLYQLSLLLQSDFKKSKDASKLNAIIRKLQDEDDITSNIQLNTRNTYINNHNPSTKSSDEPITEISKQVNPESSNQSLAEISENISEAKPLNQLITEPRDRNRNPSKDPKPRKKIPGFLRNGLSLRKVFVISLIITSGLVGLRFFAVLEGLELKTFDHLMRLRFLQEDEEDRLVIVKITDEDIQAQDERGETGYGNSLRDRSLDELLGILQQHKPRVIGLDFYRRFPVDKKQAPTLVKRLQQKNIVTVCKAPITDEQGNQVGEIPPVPEIKNTKNFQEKVGLSDFIDDIDGTVRRHLMAQETDSGTECRINESFSLLLARRYLQQEADGKNEYKVTIKAGENPRIGNVTFPAVQPFTGGYQDIDNSGFQVLLNYRVISPERFVKTLTLEDVLQERFNAQDINDKIILVGSYAFQEGPRDEWSTPYGSMNGVMVHAQMISQILSTVLDGRSLLGVWPQYIEIIWIGAWSFCSGFLVLVCYWRPLKLTGIAIGVGFLVLYLACLTSLTVASLWIPLAPAGIGFTITGSICFVIKYLSEK